MSLKNDLRNGFLISAFGKYTNLIIQFIILAILSRILTPNEFGIVAIVNVFLIFFTMVIDMGIGPAIIQNKTLSKQQVNSIFSFTILLSIVLSLIFTLIAKPVSVFYNDNQLIDVFTALSIALFTSGINMVPQSILLKEKRFLEVNIAQIASGLVSGILGVVLAFYGFSYYSLIISTIVKNLVMFILIYSRSDIRPTINIKINDLKVIYTFSRNQFLFNFINYFSRNLDSILIGKYISLRELALYDKAYTLSLYPNQILTNAITPVLQPIMSEYEKQKEVIKKTYLTLSKLLAMVGMPLTVFLFFSSKEIILILFGSQWSGSIITFQILGLSIWIQMILSSTGAIYQSANRTDLLLIVGIISTLFNICCTIVGIISGEIEYVALLLVISFLFSFILTNYILMKKVFNSSQIEYYSVLLHPLIITIFVFISNMFITLLISSSSIFFSIIIKGLASLVMFFVGIIITGNIKMIKNILSKRS